MAEYNEAIPPGGEGNITLQIDTSAIDGRAVYKALIQTNDPDRQQVAVYLSILVKAAIKIEPASSVAIKGFVGEDIKQIIYIQSMDDNPLEVNDIETNLDAYISYSIKPESRNKKYALTLASKSDTAESFKGYIKLITNHPLKNEIILDVNGRIKSIVEFWPKELIFKMSKSSDETNCQVLTIVNVHGKNLKIQEIKFNKQYFNVMLLQTKNNPDSTHQIKILPKIDQRPPNTQKIQESLLIKTNVRHAEELKIPMTLMFAPVD